MSQTPTARINACGTALPPVKIDQRNALDLLVLHYKNQLSDRGLDVLSQTLSHPSIAARYFSFDTSAELVRMRDEDPDDRVARFTRFSVDLSAKALESALSRAGLGAEAIDTVIVNTCTGYICPGISTYLTEKFQFAPGVRLYDCVGSGCGGALPNIELARNVIISGGSRNVACISVEICSATFEMGNDLSLIVSNAIFGDGAAAAIVSSGGAGFSLIDSASIFNPADREQVRFVHRRGRLHNVLSPKLPATIRKTVPPLIRQLLDRHSVQPAAVKHWAIHPGGSKMLDGIQEELQLTKEQMAESRNVLHDYGNMSSPTVIFALDRIMQKPPAPGERCCMTAYGAGLSAHTCLMQWCAA
jgi:predicted naringenin-chalcone synthase